MKRHAFITSLALGLAAFMWSCQDQGSVPLSPSEPDQVLMAKGGVKGPPDKEEPSGGASDNFSAVVDVVVAGGIISGSHEGINAGLTPGGASTLFHVELTVGDNKCNITGPATGSLGIFDMAKLGYQATYEFVVGNSAKWRLTLSDGTFTNWPPHDGETSTLTFKGWSLRALTRKGHNPCTHSGTDATTITVTNPTGP